MAGGDTAGRWRAGGTLVVGVGTAERGDDAAGLLAADEVAALGLRGVTIHRLEGSPLGLLSLWRADDAVVLIDAVRDTAAAGTIRRIDVRRDPLPGRCGGGAHDAPLAQTLALARVLGRLPRSVVLYGVTGQRFSVGACPSPDVLAAVGTVAELVRAEIGTRADRPTMQGRPCLAANARPPIVHGPPTGSPS